MENIKFKFLLFVFIINTILLVGCKVPDWFNKLFSNGNIEGVIKDSTTDEAIKNAQVILTSDLTWDDVNSNAVLDKEEELLNYTVEEEVNTNNRGEFLFNSVNSGWWWYLLVISNNQHRSYPQVLVISGETTSINLDF
jgi:hypothetical protein